MITSAPGPGGAAASTGTSSPEAERRLETRSARERWAAVRNWWARRGRRLTAESTVLSLFCVAVPAWLYRIWEASPRTPLHYGEPDSFLAAVYVRNTVEHGWWSHNPDLAAPFGATFLDLPHGGEHAQFLVLKVLGWLLGGDVGLTINAYYLAGFAITAVAAHLVLRHLGFPVLVAAPAAVTFTFLPYHFEHGTQHLWRSVYPNIPAIALVAVWATAPRHRFLVDPRGRRGSRRSLLRSNVRWPRVGALSALVVFIGSWETMAVAFAATLWALVGLVATVRQRSWAPVVTSAAVAAAVMSVVLIQMAPTLARVAELGTNEVAARRALYESELYGLKLSGLLLPDADHRSNWLAEQGARAFEHSPVPSEAGQYLGLVLGAGFLAAMVVALGYGLVGREREATDRSQLVRLAGASSLACVLLGTISGLSLLIGLVGLSQVRVWNRISVVIAFFAVLVVAVGAERLIQRLGGAGRIRVVGPAVAAAVVGLALWDTANPRVPDYDAAIDRVEHTRGFVREVEERLDTGAAVFQYPIVRFPEAGPLHAMADYDHFAPYLESRSLRWSYGAVAGRPPAHWQAALDELAVDDALPVLVGMGFSGVWIDRAGYGDHGRELIGELSARLGAPLLTDRYAFFGLDQWARAQRFDPDALRDRVVELVGVEPPA